MPNDDPQLQLFDRSSSPEAPGEYIRRELEKRRWGQEELARITGRPLPTINKIIQGTKQITPETAVDLANALGTSPDYWLAKEAAYRLSLVQSHDGSVELRAKIYSAAPIKEMIKRRWISPPAPGADVEKVICRFLEISNLDQTPRLLANARSSTAGTGFTSDQAVWCYRAYHLSKLVKVSKFIPDKIPELRLHLRHLSNLANNVQHVPKILADYGIRLVAVQHLTGTKIDGAAFWLDAQSPVISLSLRYNRVNYFWHTLGHELSHVAHRDADIDSDSFETINTQETETEKRANAEGAATFIDESEIQSFIKRISPIYSKKQIIQFANRVGVHPSIVVGQLQFRGELDWTQGSQLQSKYRETLTEIALTDGWGHSLPPFQ